MLDILKTLKIMEEIETQMGDLYDWLSGVFADDDRASTLFIRLRMEENSHRNILQYQGRVIVKNPRALREAPALDAGYMRGVLDTIARFRSREAPPSLTEAVQVALLFESAAERLYQNQEFLRSLEGLGAFVSNLHRGCKDHTTALKLFAMERGILDPPPDFPYAIPLPAGVPPA